LEDIAAEGKLDYEKMAKIPWKKVLLAFIYLPYLPPSFLPI